MEDTDKLGGVGKIRIFSTPDPFIQKLENIVSQKEVYQLMGENLVGRRYEALWGLREYLSQFLKAALKRRNVPFPNIAFCVSKIIIEALHCCNVDAFGVGIVDHILLPECASVY